MLTGYLKIAFRNFRKNKLITFINVFGLGLSMTVGMMIMIRLQDQLSFDSFHPNPDRTYRILTEYKKQTGEQWKMASTPLPLEQELLLQDKGIESSVTIYPAFNGKATAAGKELYIDGAYTEPSFFTVFGFTLASGNKTTALQEANTVVISQETASKYFGHTNAIGQLLTLDNGISFTVTGILAEPPAKSHIHFDAFASYATVKQLEAAKLLDQKTDDWFAFNSGYTYALLKKGYREGSFRNTLNNFAAPLNSKNKEGIVHFSTQPVRKINPGWELLQNEMGGGSSWSKFYFEIGIALIILLSACFNYTNLSIARSLTRAKEVGVRKVTGASRKQIFTQYITEAIAMALLALGFAWILLTFIVRYAPFNDDYEFIPSSFQYNWPLVAWSLVFALLTGLLAGASPAWLISSFEPLRVLKNMSTARIMGRINIRKALIVFQYSLSLVIIIFLVAFYRQFSYLAATDPGFKKERVLVVPLQGVNEQLALQQLNNVNGVDAAGAASIQFTKHFSGMTAPAWISDQKDAFNLNCYYADAAFIRQMGFTIIAGRNFNPGAATGTESSILINQQAVKALGLKTADQAIGQMLHINDSMQLTIAGVLKDFTYESAAIPVRPLAFRSRALAYNYLYLTARTGVNKAHFQQQVTDLLKPLLPATTTPTAASWLSDEWDQSNSQRATISLLGYLAFMAMAIATLGLLGLVMYTVEVKRKEISIRKIIGASEKQLIRLLSKGFFRLLLIAGCIAVPIGYTAGFLFLQNFPLRAGFGLVWPLGCFLFFLAIGLFTIMSQTYKAAIRNPATDMRTE